MYATAFIGFFSSSSTNRLQNSEEEKQNLDIGRFHTVCSVWFVTTTTKIKQNTATQLRWSYWNNENRKETRINTLHTQRLSHWF